MKVEISLTYTENNFGKINNIYIRRQQPDGQSTADPLNHNKMPKA